MKKLLILLMMLTCTSALAGRPAFFSGDTTVRTIKSSIDLAGSATLTAANVVSLQTGLSLTSGSLIFSNGSGFAQDNANLFWDDANNRLGIGTASPLANSVLHAVTDTSAAMQSIVMDGFGANNAAFRTRRARGTAGAPTAVLSGDIIGGFGGQGYGATGFIANTNTGAFRILADENFTDTAQGTSVSWWTTPTGSTTLAERMRVTNSGLVMMGATTLPSGVGSTRLHAEYAGGSDGFSFYNATLGGSTLVSFFAPASTGTGDGKIFQFKVPGESFGRAMFFSDGFGFGPGTGTRDAFFRRSAANVMMVDSNKAGGDASLIVTSKITAGQTTLGSVVAEFNGAAALRSSGTIVNLTADNQTVTVGDRSYVRLSSNDLTAINRTFVLSAGLVEGQLLTLEWTDTDAGELADSGAANLTGTWTPTQNDTLSMLWNGTDWLEKSRAAN